MKRKPAKKNPRGRPFNAEVRRKFIAACRVNNNLSEAAEEAGITVHYASVLAGELGILTKKTLFVPLDL
jgi:hypothetical protein